MRLIDADALLTKRKMSKYYHLPNGDIAVPIIDIEHAPPVDAVPVIRCRDCNEYQQNFHWCKLHDGEMQPTDYCSYGERREK